MSGFNVSQVKIGCGDRYRGREAVRVVIRRTALRK